MVAGCALVLGQTMVRGQVVFMHATVMKQQSKREWYVIYFVSSLFVWHIPIFLKFTCRVFWHHINNDWMNFTVWWGGKAKRDGKELSREVYSLLWKMGDQPIGMFRTSTLSKCSSKFMSLQFSVLPNNLKWFCFCGYNGLHCTNILLPSSFLFLKNSTLFLLFSTFLPIYIGLISRKIC